MTEHMRIKLNHLKAKFKDFVFEEFKDGVLVLNHGAKMGVKLHLDDLANKQLKDIERHIEKNTSLIN